MALVYPAKSSLRLALAALRKKDYVQARQKIEDALVLLEMTPAMIDPSLKLK